jgi:DNA-binding GntR family transcriptional regulator
MTLLDRAERPERLVDGILARLRAAIVGGELGPGTQLSVPALSRRLEVSRSPVREAVLQLVGHGLAVEKPRKGVVVATIDHEELVRIHEIREYLESAAARYCAERADPDGITRMDEMLDRQRLAVAGQDAAAYFRTNAELHRLIAQAAGNPRLAEILERFEGQMAIALHRVSSDPAHMREGLREHEAIVAAILNGDGEAAERAMRRHIAATLARVRRLHATEMQSG